MSEEHIKHIVYVLRAKKGDLFKIFDGSGKEYVIKADVVKKNRVTGKIIEVSSPEREPACQIVLCQSIPKGQKMDLIVRKATEIGVFEIQPVITKRSLKVLSESKLKRFEMISQSAIEQSGRLKPVKINPPLTLNEILKKISPPDKGIIFCCTEESKKIKKVLKELNYDGKIFIFIGPEGDFTQEEIDLSKTFGIIPASLGPRILRTETAGPAVLSIILYEAGDI